MDTISIEINTSDSIAYINGEPHKLVSSGQGSRGRQYVIGDRTDGEALVADEATVEPEVNADTPDDGDANEGVADAA